VSPRAATRVRAPAAPTLGIGEVAAAAGVSTRTLRYYEERGLLVASHHAAGGARRYRPEDLARLLRIRELQALLGFDLDAIGAILRGEDQLADLRAEWATADEQRRGAMLSEATDINNRLRAVVRAKQQGLDDMMAGLDDKARRYRTLARELDR